MSLIVHLHRLKNEDQRLRGQLESNELDIDVLDEMIHLNHPLDYDLTAALQKSNLFLRGRLELTLDCECVRCLRPFEQIVRLEDWKRLVPLEGDEKAEIINDSLDLTPYIREDILLAFPQNPICEEGCPGLAGSQRIGRGYRSKPIEEEAPSSAWSALDKLNLN